MSVPSTPVRCLLDKNVVRYAIAGLRYGALRPLSPLETGALACWRAAEKYGATLFIAYTSAHILQRLSGYAEVQALLAATTVLSLGPYTRRWCRRLQATTGLAPEDAMMLALSSFGTNPDGTILGVHYLITSDQSLINGYKEHQNALATRLQAMTVQMKPPFDRTSLPQVVTPDQIIAEWARLENLENSESET